MTKRSTNVDTKKVKVVLVKPHTHAGKAHEAGAEIEVRPALVPWLQRNGVIPLPPDGDLKPA